MIYLDNNATTALDPRVAEAMKPYWLGPAGNASSRHAGGRMARRAIDTASRQIAAALECEPDEVIFTSTATEANNLAILGSVLSSDAVVALSRSEHPSCVQPALELEKRGLRLCWLPLASDGRIHVADQFAAGQPELAIVQLANGETGCIQDIPALRERLRIECPIHCDAVQAIGKCEVSFRRLGVTTLSISGHKIHGPAGIAALVVRRGHRLRPLLHGGSQQRGFRPGTEPVALIAGLGKAVDLAVGEMPQAVMHMRALRDRLESKLLRELPDAIRNGPVDEWRLPHCSNISFIHIAVEPLLIALDLAGVQCSAGTACSSGSLEPSPILRAMGLEGARLESAVRFSVAKGMSINEIDEAASVIVRIVRTQSKQMRPQSL